MDGETNWLDAEEKAIAARRGETEGKKKSPRWGLALSGGGIRSSTFCLGLMKSLARNKLLTRFDYLSTVSGGGYAGSALGRLFQSVKDPAQVQQGLEKDGTVLWWWLRKNGRYLFPAGVKDSLFATSTLLRGLTAIYFDLFLLGVLLSCLIVLPHLAGMELGHRYYRWITWSPSAWWVAGAIIPFFALTSTWAYWFSAPQRPLRVFPASIAFAFVGAILSWLLVYPDPLLNWLLPHAANVDACANLATDLSVPLAALGEIGCLSNTTRLALVQITLSIPVAVGLAYYEGRRADGPPDPALARNRLARRLMWCLDLALIVVAAALLDMASWHIGGLVTRGWSAFAMGGSGLLVLIAIGRSLLKWLKDSSVAGGGVNVKRAANVAGLLLAFLFILLCASFMQVVVFYGGGFSSAQQNVREPEVWAAQAWARWLFLLVPSLLYVAATGWNLSSLNASSLHNFYRARLTRSYVSVGNPQRGFNPNALIEATPANIEALRRVSEVRPNDDIAFGEYRPHEHGGPIHLLNVCVNQTVDDRTGEFNRDRKGRNMTVSSLGCDLGSVPAAVKLEFADGVGPTLGQWVAISGAAAAPGMGANTSKGLAALLTLCGVRLGYWLDIAKKDGIALEGSKLRTLFAKYSHLMDEIFATFPGSDDPHWYISDGGHFENTAVYALLKRETDVIVCADCGADPHYAFEDLNNLVRLARIDFNARITFLKIKEQATAQNVQDDSTRQLLQRLAAFGTLAEVAAPDSSSYLVMAKIEYASGKVGHMVILKPALISTLPLDLLTYKSANPTFPQQTTADQFFDEAQWESYFRLGEELGSAIGENMLADIGSLADHFEGQLGTGLAAKATRDSKPVPRESPKFAGQVVKSSLGIGAVAGLLITLWQMLDQSRADSAAEKRRRDDAIAQSIERSMDSAGRLRVSDGGVLFLRTVMDPNAAQSGNVDNLVARDLISRLNAKCAEMEDDAKAKAENAKACADIRKLAGHFAPEEVPGSVVAYWAGSGLDKDLMKQVPVVALAAPPRPPTAAAPAPGPAPAEAPGAEKLAVPKPAPSPAEATKPRAEASALALEKAPPADTNQRISGAVTAAAESCRGGDHGKVHVYAQVYRKQEADALNGVRGQAAFQHLRKIVDFAPVENVVENAQTSGTRIPYRWSKPTFIYHNDTERDCAEKLATVYAEAFGTTPAIRPLPERLKKQPGAVELWVPPIEEGKS